MDRNEHTEQTSTFGKFEKVAIDILDVTTVSDKGNRFILVVADHFSKYCWDRERGRRLHIAR